MVILEYDGVGVDGALEGRVYFSVSDVSEDHWLQKVGESGPVGIGQSDSRWGVTGVFA